MSTTSPILSNRPRQVPSNSFTRLPKCPIIINPEDKTGKRITQWLSILDHANLTSFKLFKKFIRKMHDFRFVNAKMYIFPLVYKSNVQKMDTR